MNAKLLMVALPIAILFGCATTETVKEAEGEGDTRIYLYPYELVFEATLAAAANQELKVIEKDREAKRVVLSHGVTWWSWGEKIAIFFEEESDEATKVEIVSKPIVAPANFPPDWENILLNQIGIELRAKTAELQE